MKAQRITDTISHHGEGPCWWPATGRLRFVDMLAGSVIELDEGGGRGYRRLPVPSPVASVIRPRAGGGRPAARGRGTGGNGRRDKEIAVGSRADAGRGQPSRRAK